MNTAQLKELSTTSYWNTRYQSEQEGQQAKQGSQKDGEEKEYEWFRTFEQIKPFLEKHLPPPSSDVRILQLGCGTSVSCSYSSKKICTLEVSFHSNMPSALLIIIIHHGVPLTDQKDQLPEGAQNAQDLDSDNTWRRHSRPTSTPSATSNNATSTSRRSR